MQLDENKFSISVWIQIAALLETEKLICLLKPASWADVGFLMTVKTGHKIETRVKKVSIVVR